MRFEIEKYATGGLYDINIEQNDIKITLNVDAYMLEKMYQEILKVRGKE
jgi:hypothetical protein